MRHRLAAPAVVLLVALPAWLGAAPSPVSPPFPVPEVSAAAARAGATVPDAAEGHRLSAAASGAVVAGRDHRGALYGVSRVEDLR